MAVPSAYDQLIRTALVNEVSSNFSNPMYGILRTLIQKDNGRSHDMEKLVIAAYIHAQCLAEETGKTIQECIPFSSKPVCEAKLATLISQMPGQVETLNPDQTAWFNRAFPAAQALESKLQDWIRSKEAAAAAGTGGKPSDGGNSIEGSFKRSVRQVVAPVIDTGPIDGSQPAAENPEQFMVNGLYQRPLRRKPINPETEGTGYKTKRLVRRTGPSDSSTDFNHNGFSGNPGSENAFGNSRSVMRRVFGVEADDTPDTSQSSTPSAGGGENHKRDIDMKLFHFLSLEEFEENGVKYEDHQRYHVFKPKASSSAESRDVFMRGLDSAKLVTGDELAVAELTADGKPAFVWHPETITANSKAHATVKMVGKMLDVDLYPNRNMHFAYNYDQYNLIRCFDDKSSLEIYLENYPALASLFDKSPLRDTNSVSLHQVHAAMVETTKALQQSGSGDIATEDLLAMLNTRLTEQVNFALKYDAQADLTIDDFMDDWIDLVGVMGERVSPEILELMTGETVNVGGLGTYVPFQVANLIYAMADEVSKDWDRTVTTTQKKTSQRGLFLVERHCVCDIHTSFTANIALAAKVNEWSEFRCDANPAVWNLLTEMVGAQPAGTERLVHTYHLRFSDGVEIEAKLTSLDFDKHDPKRVFLARVVGEGTF